MSGASDRLTRALSHLGRLGPGATEQVRANLDALHLDYREHVLGYAFADIVGRDGMDLKTREMTTVAMPAAMGTAPGQLEFHMRAAMNTGVSREEIVEIVMQVSVYAGVPTCMNAITAAKNAFEVVEKC
ncbi:MAG: carboxymuconolactone decarboxylase family protein [Pseudomonadota bacterium]